MVRVSRPLLAIRRSVARHSEANNPKPTWEIPREARWHPQIPDKFYYSTHWYYRGPTLFFRFLRPYFSKIGTSVYKTTKDAALCVGCPLWRAFERRCPDFRHQMVAVFGFTSSMMYISGYFNSYLQSYADVVHGLRLQQARELEKKGFWNSESADDTQKRDAYDDDHVRLSELWESAIGHATETRSFDVLCSYLQLGPITSASAEPDIARFNMLPYGSGDPDTKTFGKGPGESRSRGLDLSATDAGDYVERKDPKKAVMRHARPLFTEIYVPPTK